LECRYTCWATLLGYTDLKVYDYAPVFKYQNENKFGGGLSVVKALSNVFSIRGQFLYGGVAGTKRGDAYDAATNKVAADDFTGTVYYPSGRYFKTNIMEGSIQLIFNVSNLSFTGKVGQDRKFALYMFAGHGLVSFETELFRLLTDDKVDQTGKTTEAVNPVGLGLKFKINNKFDLTLEGTMRRVNSDKLDAFAVKESANDYYGYTALGFNYKFGKAGADGESIEWVNPLEAMNNDIHQNRERINTLTGDNDADGVSNFFDKDSNTPEGDKVDGAGVSLDVDGDGVPDSQDEDNFTPRGAKVNESGVAIDSDGDGVPDALDLEPNTEKGQLVNFQGVSIDKSGEGSVSAGGAAYFPSIHFDMNGVKIKYNQYDKIATIARALKANAGVKLTLTGHADKTGSEEYNLKLGERRAQAVVDHLVKYYGLGADRFIVSSKGESEPLADGINSINRRVDADLN